jgi:hypothetical protein
MCNHEFGKEYEAKIVYQVDNPWCYLGSADIRMVIDKEKYGYARTCKNCGFTEFTVNIKNILVPDFE